MDKGGGRGGGITEGGEASERERVWYEGGDVHVHLQFYQPLWSVHYIVIVENEHQYVCLCIHTHSTTVTYDVRGLKVSTSPATHESTDAQEDPLSPAH